MILTNLIAGGVNLVEALEIVKNSISNTKIQASLEKVKREIYSGRPFSTSLRDTKDFPETMCGFIEVGEETGKLNEMLNTVALYYEEEFSKGSGYRNTRAEQTHQKYLGHRFDWNPSKRDA